MAVIGQASERRLTNTPKPRKQRVDRLSFLPDDILIVILSCLPLRFAIATGCLSRRWRGLWTNVTHVHLITKYRCEELHNFFKAIDETMTQITSPFINSFILEFWDMIQDPRCQCSFDYWFHQIYDRNVRELKVRCYGKMDLDELASPSFVFQLPSFVFQLQSLVSLELGPMSCFKLSCDCDLINLPNLKKLSLHYVDSYFEWMEKLILACPSLEELSLDYRWENKYKQLSLEMNAERQKNDNYKSKIKCSNQNLRRLFVNLGSRERYYNDQLVINAPKLDYLNVRGTKFSSFRFDEEPSVLREADIQILCIYDLSNEETRLTSKFYDAISKVRILTLDVFTLNNMSTVFDKATQVTLDMGMSDDLEIVSTLLELCPVLDNLTLKLHDIGRNGEHKNFSSPSSMSAFRRVFKKISIETYWYSYCKPTKSFLGLLDYLLSIAIDLEYLGIKVIDRKDYWVKGCVERRQRRELELELCELLYHCPRVSRECEVEFLGMVSKMSRKAGPKVCGAKGEVITFYYSP